MSKVILTQQEKSNLSNITATSVIYDNTTSGMQVENVQTAIDSLSRQSSSTINKINEIISPETLNLYNLPDSATSNDVFNQLGQYNLHTWRRWPTGTGYVVTLGETFTITLISSYSSSSVTIYYSSSASASSSGVQLGNSSTISIPRPSIYDGNSGDEITTYNVIKGKYIKIGTNNTVYYVPSNSKMEYEEHWSVTSSGGVHTDSIDIQLTVQRTGYAYSGSSVTYQYLTSTDENAYPKSGTSGSWNYEYLGVPFNNLINPNLKFEILTYIGNGGAGPNNACTITASFKPKIIFLYPKFSGGNSSYYPSQSNYGIESWGGLSSSLWGGSGNPGQIIIIPNDLYTSKKVIGGYGNSDDEEFIWFQVTNNTIKWWIADASGTYYSSYSSSGSSSQWNESGQTYYVGILGE